MWEKGISGKRKFVFWRKQRLARLFLLDCKMWVFIFNLIWATWEFIKCVYVYINQKTLSLDFTLNKKPSKLTIKLTWRNKHHHYSALVVLLSLCFWCGDWRTKPQSYRKDRRHECCQQFFYPLTFFYRQENHPSNNS